MPNPRAPETHPKPGGCGRGCKNPPADLSRAGFSQPRAFRCGRVFAAPAPAPESAGAIPGHGYVDLGRSGACSAVAAMAARGWSVEKRWGTVVEWIRLGLGGGVGWPGLGRAKFVCAGFKTSEKFERYTKKPSPTEKHDFQIYRKFFAEKKTLDASRKI